ncbi:MAG: MarR family transcriptional regulator [Acidimicrobiales bacterium]
MSENEPDAYATPTLMRAARGAYSQAIRAHLQAMGVDDLPRNGAFILVGIDTSGGPRQDLPSGLGVTKQAVSKVIDALVTRGFLARSPDPDDRRRNALELTEQGRRVVAAVIDAVDAVDRQVRERVSAEDVEATRRVLQVMGDIKVAGLETGAGRRRTTGQGPQLGRFSPILPVANLEAAMAHYATLGFKTFAYEEGADYGFAERDDAALHLATHAGHDPTHHGSSTYLSVRDADALYEEWSRPGIEGHTHAVGLTDYGMREGSHVDPDGNLIRFGSPAGD